jgi:hypothetical protein
MVIAQNTNPDRVVASALQMRPSLSTECLDFLLVTQNLSRAKTADHPGTTGLVKVNSTHTRTKVMPTMDLISTLSR